MLAEMSLRIFPFLSVVVCLLLHQICCLSTKPLEFAASDLIRSFENSVHYYRRENEKHQFTPDESFTILKILSLCNIKSKQLKNITSLFFCEDRCKEYDVIIRNVNIIYGRFVHSGNQKSINDIRFFCKYYLVDNTHEIVSCYERDFSFGPFFFGFEISKSHALGINSSGKNDHRSNKDMHEPHIFGDNGETGDHFASTSDSVSISGTVNDKEKYESREMGENGKISHYYCKLKTLVNSYVTTNEEKLLKMLTGLCIILGYEKQFFMSSNVYPIMKHYEQSASNKLLALGYNVSNSILYESNVLYNIKGFNAFVYNNEYRLVNNVVPTAYLQFTTRESYLIWRGIKGNQELFNKKVVELKNLLNQVDFKNRIKLCYQASLVNYYEEDEIYLTRILKNKLRHTHFRNVNKTNETSERTKDDTGDEKDEEKDSFLTVFNYLCGDENITSFEECVYQIINSTILDEKSKSAFHQLLYDAMMCLETCPPIVNLKILNDRAIITRLQNYLEQIKHAAFKTNKFSREVEEKLKKSNYQVHGSSNDDNKRMFLPQDENIKTDFFENIMFFFEYHSISPLLRDELDKINKKQDLESRICNIGKFLKGYGKVYVRGMKSIQRSLEETDDLKKLLTNSIDQLGFGSILKELSTLSEEEGLHLDIKRIKEKLHHFHTLSKEEASKSKEDIVNEEKEEEVNDGVQYFFEDDEDDEEREDEFEEVQRSKGKLISTSEDAEEENDDDGAEIDSLGRSHESVMSMIPLLLKMNNMLKKKERKEKKNSKIDEAVPDRTSLQSSFFMHIGNTKVHILEKRYQYDVLEKLFSEKKEEAKTYQNRRKEFFDYIEEYFTYGFTIENVPSKWDQLLTHGEVLGKTQSNEQIGTEKSEAEFNAEHKHVLHFLCSGDDSWPLSKKLILFYRNNSIYCEAALDSEFIIEVHEKEELFQNLLKKMKEKNYSATGEETERINTSKESDKKENSKQEREVEVEEDKNKDEFFFVDTVFYSHRNKAATSDTDKNTYEESKYMGEGKEKITEKEEDISREKGTEKETQKKNDIEKEKNKYNDSDRSSSDNGSYNTETLSKLIGFNLYGNVCAVKYIGNKNEFIIPPYLNIVLLKSVFGFCILHGFTVLRIDTEIINPETGIKSKILEILTNGKTEYEYLGLHLMNIAVFPKENYYITTGFLPNTNKNLMAYLKFQKNFYVEHNIDKEFLDYMNKKTMNLLHNLTFRCDENYEPYLNCYEIYPLVRKRKDHRCFFERNKTFVELNMLFPNDCAIGKPIRRCYKQIKKNIPCFKQSKGCKYYNFLVDTFLVPKKKYFFMEHKKNVHEYISKKVYIYYHELLRIIKNDEIHNLIDNNNGYTSKEKKNEENEENVKSLNGEENDDDDADQNEYDYDIETYALEETEHAKTDNEAFHLLNYLIHNSAFFTFWNFSAEYWKRLGYIHDISSKNGLLWESDEPVRFCPVAYAYEFIYHLNSFYVWK